MKKPLAFLLPIAIMASCGNNGGQKSADSATLANDSLIEALADTISPQEEPQIAYLSPDLKKFNLHGQVKQVSPVETTPYNDDFWMTTCLNARMNFNKEGKLTTTFGDFIDNKITLNNEGFVKSTYSRESDGINYNLTFTKWDADNNPIEGTYKMDGYDMAEYALTLTYDKYDNNGNWTSRKVKYTGKIGSLDEEGEPQYRKVSGTVTDTRTITYWE